MLENDYCPYCGVELEPDEVVEVTDIDGDEQARLVECPNCGKHIRASFELVLCMSLTSEEYYLENLKLQRRNYERELKTEYGQESKDYFEMLIKEVDGKISEAYKHQYSTTNSLCSLHICYLTTLLYSKYRHKVGQYYNHLRCHNSLISIYSYIH